MGSLDGLPRDILQLIAEKIIDHKDILRFGVVCKQWRSIVMDNLHLLPPKLPLSLCLPSNKTPPLPLLMQCRNEDELGAIEFFSVSNNRNYSGFVVPEINKKWLAGSSHGWLFTIDIHGQEINLLNPLTRTQIPLPSLSAFQYPTGCYPDAEADDFGFIAKAVISSDPSRRNSDGNCIVVAIIANFEVLSFCRPGDGKWTNVELSGCPIHLTDVLLYNGQFYAVNEMGIVVVFDVAQGKKVKKIANRVGMWGTKRYLVKSMTGELLHVERIMDEETGSRTVEFNVYMLEAVDEPVEDEGVHYSIIDDDEHPNVSKFNYDGVELESLGDDQVLFVGLNYSLAVPAVQIPGCKGNCIYFTTQDMYNICIVRGDVDEKEALCDMGIYDLAGGRVRSFDEVDVKFLIPPIWVSPSL